MINACRKVGTPFVVAWIAFMVIGLSTSTAHAQIGIGMGMGGDPFVFYNFNQRYVSSPTDFLYDRANAQISAASNAVRSGRQTAAASLRDSPNAYFNRVRDFSGGGLYDVSTRRSLEARTSAAARYPLTTPAAATASAAATAPAAPVATREALPFTAFFKSDGTLDWTGDAPADESGSTERSDAERALQTVRSEIQASGKAGTQTLGDARFRLVNYGRKALAKVRETRSAAVSDVFHYYLLFLNQALDQAGESPGA